MRDVAFAISAGIVLGGGMLAASAFAARRYDRLPRDNAHAAAKMLVGIAREWRLERGKHPDECPTIALLRSDGALSVDQHTDDPWGMPYVFFCPHETDIVALSAGPDRRYGTADDITSESR